MKSKINWHDIKIAGIQWVVFALLLAGFSIFCLLNERKTIKNELSTCQANWNNIQPQLESGRVILELKNEGF